MTTPTSSSRTEQVRQRRTSGRNRKTTAKRSFVRARKPDRTPPVITRGGKVVMPTRPIEASRTRRRYDVSLGAPGAELQLPAMPSFRWSWRIVSGLLTLLLLGALYAIWTMPRFQVNTAEITGLRRISERDVNLVLGLANTPIFILHAETMKSNLIAAFPEFSNATVRLNWPNKVAVTVTERIPVLAWTAGGQTVWVDAQGMSFPVRGEGEAESLVAIEADGPPPAPPVGGDASVELSAWSRPFMSVDLVSAVLLINGFASNGVTLLFDKDHGLGWRDSQGWQVYFGTDGSDMGQRLQVYQAIVAELNEQQIYPALISVEHLHAPFYRIDK